MISYVILPEQLLGYEQFSDRLLKPPRPSKSLDREVHRFLLPHIPVEQALDYTASIESALSLVPSGWWWHLSHLEVSVSPTTTDLSLPISDATDYHFNGRPVQYSVHTYGDRRAIPSALCAALVRARLALLAKVAALTDQRRYLIQTGEGPMMVETDGRLKELPVGAWLSEDGRLVAHRTVFPTYDPFEEPEPDEEA